MRSWRIAAACWASLWLGVAGARAETIRLLPSKDTCIYSFSQIIGGVETGYLNNSAGAAMGIFVGCNATASPTSSNVRRALIAFDLATLPAEAQVQAVTLTLGMDRTSDTQSKGVSLHRLLADWGEGLAGAGGTVGVSGGGGQGSPAEQNDATWLYRFWDAALGVAGQPNNPLKWGTPGGDFILTASATANVGIGKNAVCQYTWADLDPADPDHSLLADVRYWQAHPAENFGWILLGDEFNASTARRFQTRENETTAVGEPTMDVNGVPTGNVSFEDYRPHLTVTYVLDSDADGVPDAQDLCSGTVTGALVDAQGCPPSIPGDFNHNGAVDAEDLMHLKTCTLGPAVPQLVPECANARLDADDDVDQDDFGIFQRCWSGTAPGAPACAD